MCTTISITEDKSQGVAKLPGAWNPGKQTRIIDSGDNHELQVSPYSFNKSLSWLSLSLGIPFLAVHFLPPLSEHKTVVETTVPNKLMEISPHTCTYMLWNHNNLCVYSSLVPRPLPSFLSLAVRWSERGYCISSHEWRHRQDKLSERGRHVNHKKKLRLHARTGARLFRVERWQRTKALLCCSSQDSWEDKEFYQAKTVKTHRNNLVMLAQVQLKSFYCLPTHDVTHVSKCTRRSPAIPYCKRREAGWGPGNEATFTAHHVRTTYP